MTPALRVALTLVLFAWAAAPAAQAEEPAPEDALAWTVGTWEGLRYDGDAADEPGVPMTVRVEPILGGAGYVEHLDITHDEGEYHGFAVMVFDPEDRVWVRQYVNATRGRFVRLEGTVEGDVGTWRVVPEPGAEPVRYSKQVFERLDDGGWRRTLRRTEDGGETWRVVWRDELKRAGAP